MVVRCLTQVFFLDECVNQDVVGCLLCRPSVKLLDAVRESVVILCRYHVTFNNSL